MFDLTDPKPDGGQKVGAFDSGGDVRPLKILIDQPETLETELFEYLRSFENHELVEIVTTFESSRMVVVGPLDQTSSIRAVRVKRPTGFRDTAIPDWNFIQHLTSRTVESRAHIDQDHILKIEDAHLVAAIAESIGAHITVSGNEEFHNIDLVLRKRANFLSLREAIHALGIFLRSHMDGTVQLGPNFRQLMDLDEQSLIFIWTSFPNIRDLFWRVREIGKENEIEEIAVALVRRLQQLVIVSDRSVQRKFATKDTMAGTNFRIEFDSATVFAAGTLDAIARLIDNFLKIGTSNWDIGMRRESWKRKVSQNSPEIGSSLTKWQPQIDLIHTFRNHIHGETYADIEARESGNRTRRLLRIPPRSANKIVSIHSAAQLESLWSIKRLTDGSYWIEVPDVLHWMRNDTLKFLSEVAGEILTIIGKPRPQQSPLLEFLPGAERWCSLLFGESLN